MGEFIAEMSIAKMGDWEEGLFHLDPMSEIVAKTKWELFGQLIVLGVVFELRKSKSSDAYMLGNFQTFKEQTKSGIEEIVRFRIIMTIGLGRDYRLSSAMARVSPLYPKIVNINGIIVDKDFQGVGVARKIYKWLVNEQGFTVMGDSRQYFGARKLWARLSEELDVIVDLVDIKRGKVLETNVKLHHGNQETDFDTRLWSLGVDKKNIRPFLRKIPD